MSTRRAACWLKGKVIKDVELNAFDPNAAGYTRLPESFDPVIRFTDGSSLAFKVDETEVGEYGLQLVYRPRPRGG